MKKSVVLVEVIFSIVLFSIVLIGSMKMVFSLYKANNTKTFQTHNNIKLEATRLFLIKNKNLVKLKIEDTNLYYDENLLLDNISTFKISTNGLLSTVDICIYDDKICQVWKIK